MGRAIEPLVARRLAAQALTRRAPSVAAAARQLFGIQAQDLPQAQWALASRAEGATLATVDAAFARGEIVRSWPMRGTLHVVPAEDAPWLAAFFRTRNLARHARRLRELEIEARDVAIARDVVESVLGDAGMPREELFTHLVRAGQRVERQRGVLLLWHLAQDGVLCLAGDRFILAARRIASPRLLAGDEALGELARRYRRGHGPTTVEDLAFWCGLPKGVARRAIEIAGDTVDADGAAIPDALLLPGFDEYLLGYADRSACIAAEDFARIVPGGNGVFLPMLVLRGQVRGTWRR
ncbi:MAG: winged helix DNA-binding domain-containing protein, partial [Gemmatimonadaceae bacterium]|nr:winged helix DNA-binding domain-containing protein [Gemmatimonadaceae bacterium]